MIAALQAALRDALLGWETFAEGLAVENGREVSERIRARIAAHRELLTRPTDEQIGLRDLGCTASACINTLSLPAAFGDRRVEEHW